MQHIQNNLLQISIASLGEGRGKIGGYACFPFVAISLESPEVCEDSVLKVFGDSGHSSVP